MFRTHKASFKAIRLLLTTSAVLTGHWPVAQFPCALHPVRPQTWLEYVGSRVAPVLVEAPAAKGKPPVAEPSEVIEHGSTWYVQSFVNVNEVLWVVRDAEYRPKLA
ncbi:hypothetical protein DAEQUDRAFT_729780 [Daedalea quercina L-15889]|uniref:Uncharacterized protein n=1 Tax=Daedalea quercina L-15889 TaxID=1314783 RepID=A0A165NCQ3_9APHY|nr:hypothetical protein DAEQUDRAFT_729780 [Daedalea quercina L-15889]